MQAAIKNKDPKFILARMSIMTYSDFVNGAEKPLRWLHGEVKTPPFSRAARLEAGLLLRRLQQGENSFAAPFATVTEYWRALSRTAST